MNPALDQTAGTGYQRPRDPVEIWLARCWQDILGFAVGIGENFFSVGGNSLDAARVIDAVLVEFGVQLPLNVLAEQPTVELLAALLRGHAGRLSGPVVVIQDGDGTRPALFLVHPDDGQAGVYCRVGYGLGEEFAVSALQAAGLAGWQERGLVPRDVAPEFAARSLGVWRANRDAVRDWRPSPYAGPVDVFGLPPAMALPATVVQRRHECGTDGQLAGALRELIG